MQPRIQYTRTTDGVDVAYWVIGAGPPVIWVSTIFTSHLSQNWEIWREMYRDVARYCTVVKYDNRGSGLSDRDATDFSLDARVMDLDSVRLAAGFGKVSLLASGHAAIAAAAYAAEHPDQVERLVVMSPYASGEELYRLSPPMKFIASLESVTEDQWEFVTMSMASRMFPSDADAAKRLADTVRAAMDPKGLIRFRDANRSIDIAALLPKITAPTLVVHHPDSEWPAAFSRRFATAIPNAELLSSKWVGVAMLDPNERAAVIKFMTGADYMPPEDTSPAPSVPSGTAIILFADIADSTSLTERLGDAAFRAKARDLDAALRTVIREHAGTAIEGKLLGDGVLAVFTSARQAIEAALACASAGSDAGLPLHLGLHAGDVIREEGNVYGGAVNVAARISGLSARGEVLVSETVRSLARTSAGVRFEDRGERELKGVGEAVRVWVVVASPNQQTGEPANQGE